VARAKKDSKGRFYEVIELTPGINGKRQRKFIRAKTAALLKEKVARFYAELEQGLDPIRRTAGEHTVASWLSVWLDGEWSRDNTRASTLKRYDSAIRNHINPLIGKILLRNLTYDQVQQMLDYAYTQGKKIKDKDGKETRGPLAAQSVRNILSPLSEALDAALKRGLVRKNVAKDLELPAMKQPDLYKLTPEEIQRFLVAVRGDRLEALYWLAILGLRQGELLGLRWKNCDLEVGEVRVTEAAQRVKRPNGESKLRWVNVKTENGRRTIRLPEDWINVLREHRARQDEERLAVDWREHDLVFPSTEGTLLEATNLVNRYFKPALTRAGLAADKIRFHDLRHGAASMFIVLGYDARTVADILGHSSPNFTMRQYAHSFEEVRERAIVDVGVLLKNNARVLERAEKKTRDKVDTEEPPKG
jgi:integrase